MRRIAGAKHDQPNERERPHCRYDYHDLYREEAAREGRTLLVSGCRGRFFLEPIRKPLTKAAQAIDEQPGFARSRQIVIRPRIADELRRYSLLFERHEPQLGVAHWRAIILLALNEQG